MNCAPHRKGDTTCYTKEQLIKMAKILKGISISKSSYIICNLSLLKDLNNKQVDICFLTNGDILDKCCVSINVLILKCLALIT